MNKEHQETRCADQRIELIATDRIVISKYQRPISVRRAAKIAQEFDAAKLGFRARLRSRVPSDLLDEYHRRTNGRSTTHNAFDRSMRYVLCGVFVDAYNKGLPSKSRMRLRLVWDMPPIECGERGMWQ